MRYNNSERFTRSTARRFGIRRAPRRAASPFRASRTMSSAAASPPWPMDGPRGRRHVRLLVRRRQPRLVLRSGDGRLRPVPEHGGRPLVRDRHDARRRPHHGVLRTDAQRWTRTKRWRSTISETPAPDGAARSPRPSSRRFTRECALLPNGKVFYTGHGSGGSNANGWIFDPVGRRPGHPRFRRLGTGPTARP